AAVVRQKEATECAEDLRGWELGMSETPKWLENFLGRWPELAKARLDYMPLYPGKFLGADAVEDMDGQQKCAYLMLLLRAWQQKPPSIPDDDDRLRRWLGLSPAKWKENRDALLKPFTPFQGRFYQRFLCEVWVESATRYAK